MNTAKAQPAPVKTNAVSAGKLTPVKPEPAPLSPIREGETIPPLDDRLFRLNQLFKLQGDYNKLQESLNKLNDFEIKKDGERSRLSIADDSRSEFSTYHPEMVEEVVSFLKTRIKEKIKSIEPKLIW